MQMGKALIVKGDFKGMLADILVEQQNQEYRDPFPFAYQLRLPGCWIVNLPADWVVVVEKESDQ